VRLLSSESKILKLFGRVVAKRGGANCGSLNSHFAGFHCGTKYSCFSRLHRFWQQSVTNRTHFVVSQSHEGELALGAFDSVDFYSFDFVRVWNAIHFALFPLRQRCVVDLREL
jgi:hypothetical protein